jgi:phosphoribosylanthranilate isomerase
VTDLEVPRIKICGVTSLADARLVVEAGADALGLIYAASVRQVVGDVASDIVVRYGDQLWCVGVFRNQRDHEVVRIVERDALRVVQLHDPASEALLDALATRNVRIIRALSVYSPSLNSRETDDVVAVIVDSAQPGSGVPNDWDAVASLRFDVPMLVAGGLTADTVRDVIAATSPWGVDVASGVEAAHGVKDRAKVASFVGRARAALTQKGAQ